MAIFLLFLSLFAWSASVEDVLKDAASPTDFACPPVAPGYCQDFQSEGCRENEFQPDGTGEVRTLAVWNERVKKGKGKVLTNLSKELIQNYKKLPKARWIQLAVSQGLKKDCQKFPATASCLSLMAKTHGTKLLDASMQPITKQNHGPFLDDGKRGDFEGILPQTSLDKYEAQLLEEVRYKDDETKMRSMVDRIKDLIKEKIISYNFDEATKNALFGKLDKTSFKGFECNDNNELRSYSIDGAFNTHVGDDRHEISYCAGNFRTNSSSFNLAYLLAHEFSHSIDPCNVKPKDISKNEREFLEKQHPFNHILSCLRSPDSVGAQWSPDFYKNNLPNLSLCVGDQIGESFADWMAAEVVPQYIEEKHGALSEEQWKQGFLNVSRTLSCKTELLRPGQENGVDSHPRPAVRINKIMLANSKIKSLVGCKDAENSAVQCSGDTNLAELRPPRNPVTRIGLEIPVPNLRAPAAQTHDPACFVKH